MIAWLLVTQNSNEYKRTRFLEEAKKLSLDLVEVSPDDFTLSSSAGGNSLIDATTGQKITELPAFVISLVVVEKKDPHAFRLLDHLHSMGIFTLNTPDAIRHANDKMFTYQQAAKLQLPIPKTTVLSNANKLESIEEEFAFPLVCKPNYGLKGQDVALVNSNKELEEYLATAKEPTIVQEAITESAGRDARVLLIGSTILGCLERSSDETFTSNVATGANGKSISLPKATIDSALRIAAHMQLIFCSVDFLYGNDGLILCEVNANPGFTMFETATDKNVAREILQFCQDYVSSRKKA